MSVPTAYIPYTQICVCLHMYRYVILYICLVFNMHVFEMYVYILICVYVHMCVYVILYSCLLFNMYVFLCMSIYVCCVSVHIYQYLYTCKDYIQYMCECALVSIHACVYVYIYVLIFELLIYYSQFVFIRKRLRYIYKTLLNNSFSCFLCISEKERHNNKSF